jgi:hypothetical protein
MLKGVGRELDRFAYYLVIPAEAGTQAAPKLAEGAELGNAVALLLCRRHCAFRSGVGPPGFPPSRE